MKTHFKTNEPTFIRQLDYIKPGEVGLVGIRQINTQLVHNKTTQIGKDYSRLDVLQKDYILLTNTDEGFAEYTFL
ncbi:hypothetical protein A2Z22_04800 [Candidatus Woesebacteria bacterium RBG_16_34_12]|uniref:Uncharacterized protein n=1 Tax=Candidatus Woesebacteria bacterium RBG_16_34_12 TaxID=1802480 RepID=A0A1F7XAC0_9BACT|nr:MAG: hypothetical protein A2Z22_04800 [Candidatus Woesebacteria bacterium RBG_16_34_12]